VNAARDVLVTGGTGTLGQVVVPQLLHRGHRVRVMSREPGPQVCGAPRVVADLATGHGVVAALRGAHTLVHLASNPLRARRTDVQGTTKMLAAAAKVGVRHVVYLSIVGCDANPYPYYRAKAEVERVVLEGPVPGTVLRATQFHDFVPRLAAMLTVGPIMLLPKDLRGQLVDLRDVSQRLTELVEGEPAGRVRDLAGPQVLDLRDAVDRWHEALGRPRPRVLTLPAVGGSLKAFAAGSNLPGPQAELGTRTYDAWLDELHRTALPDLPSQP
jgi:uncharacterized protein YbjT (DUF2867 family)